MNEQDVESVNEMYSDIISCEDDVFMNPDDEEWLWLIISLLFG
jgi:hypothetical protein